MVPFQIYSLKNIYNAPKHKTLYLLFDLFEITCVFRKKKKKAAFSYLMIKSMCFLDPTGVR